MYEALDLYFTADGDLGLSSDGDLRDTRDDPYRSLRQEVYTVAQANYGDWALHPDLGANLEELVGRPNDEATAELLKAQLAQALERHLLRSGTFRIDSLPLDRNVLGVLVTVRTADKEGEPQTVVCPIIFDLGLGVYIT